MTFSKDQSVTIIGSGPAGTSAAFPLVEAGINVKMIEAGSVSNTPEYASIPTLCAFRSGFVRTPEYVQKINLRALDESFSSFSPKLRGVSELKKFSNYLSHNSIKTNCFKAIGILDPGGLSNFWGAVVDIFDDEDLACPVLRSKDLLPSYISVAHRIGISGILERPKSFNEWAKIPLMAPIPLSPIAQYLHDQYQNHGPEKLSLSGVQNAILTEDKESRSACDLGGTCHWGCQRKSIYNSRYDVDRLLQHDNFILHDNTLVTEISCKGTGYELELMIEGNNEPDIITATTVILAAGTIPTSKMVLKLQERYDQSIPLQTTPSFSFALWVPRKFGTRLSERSFGLSQLSFRAPISNRSGDTAVGLLYDAAGIPAADIIAHMPLTRPGAIDAYRLLSSSLMFGMVYLPGEYSLNTARLQQDENTKKNAKLIIKGEQSQLFPRAVQKIMKQLRQQFFGIGGFVLPGSMKIHPSGSDIHYGSTFPIGKDISAVGEITGYPGLYIADGAGLPRMPSKHPTFTIMANADRIGRYISNYIG